MRIDNNITHGSLRDALGRFFAIAAEKIPRLQRDWDPARGTPVFTQNGQYTTRGWTEWTQGFMYGAQILAFDATGDTALLRMGRENTIRYMAPHVSHTGVHDHGFNNISTYGNLWRLAREGRTAETDDALAFYELAIKVSGAVQASRWTTLADGTGFIHSFNGPHSLFSDTIRSCRALMLAARLGHTLMGEGDRPISLRARAKVHVQNTLRYNVFFGEGRDIYDIRGRVAHEGLFNTKDGSYRCPSTQQGYSPFSTWTRGLAWVLLGCAELWEFVDAVPDGDTGFSEALCKGARATADFYIENTAADGIPYWDTGAPGLARLGDYLAAPAQPDNPWEPVDSSAAAIAAQGLLRLGRRLGPGEGARYTQTGLNVARTLFAPPYLSEAPAHHGLLLHSVYHRPRGWDTVPEGKCVPQGESSMWGDYHAMELAVYLQREIEGGDYLAFFSPTHTESAAV